MSNAAEWIDFATLCARAPMFSKRTLERMIATRQITSRQRIARGKRDFNWALVERELGLLDNKSAKAPVLVEESDVRRELAQVKRLLVAMAAKLGIDPEGRAVA
jgi:hypothetical protein